MENFLVSNFLVPLGIGIIILVIGLIIEYRTSFFAKHIENLKPHGQGEPSQTSRQGFLVTNWAEVTKQARINLAAIYGVKPEEIYVIEWHIVRFAISRRLQIDFKIPAHRIKEMGLLERPWELYFYCEADRDGRILKIDRYYL
jgi:hypothetical protein